MPLALLITVFLIATCGLIYELIAGTLASYLLGDSVTQFSLVIGVYLFSMGVGSLLTQKIQRDLLGTFVRVELLIALLGGFSAAGLFWLFPRVDSFRVVLFGLVSLIGILVGVEIPLLMRVLKDRIEFNRLVAQVFGFDYVGALLASVLFPLLLVPHLGLVRGALVFGFINALVAVWSVWLFRASLPQFRMRCAETAFVVIVLLVALIGSSKLELALEGGAYSDPVVYSQASSYQKIVITQRGDDTRLYLNGNLQFSSRDEYRYHEALVHPVLAAMQRPIKVLVMGGGDGLAMREVLRYPNVTHATLVDLDPAITSLFQTQEGLRKLNADALNSKRVTVVNADAFIWLRDVNRERYDVIIADFPDPSNFSVGKLFTTAFYKEMSKALAPEGRSVIQATSPAMARRSYWCMDKTLRSAGLQTLPYHAYVPSFGEWGFIMAAHNPLAMPVEFPAGLKFMDRITFETMCQFPADMARVDTPVQTLNSQALVHLYEEEWSRYTGP